MIPLGFSKVKAGMISSDVVLVRLIIDV